ncbi:MAG: dTDP-4-dehydrorhamnose reductase family protein, partial [Candidatus Nitrosocosmicus sp.]
MEDSRILVLGAGGMAGHIVYDYLKKNTLYEIIGIARKSTVPEVIILDVTNFAELEFKIKEIKPVVIINAVGVLIKGSESFPENAILLNSYLPHFLVSVSRKYNSKLIHISTDCVFSGKRGGYTEHSFPDSDSIYGRSKSLGEIRNEHDLTIRTSIIGPEIKNNGEGLFDWFMKSKGTIKGFTDVYWSGITTLELAKAIKIAIENRIIGLIHLTNNQKISKYDLLCIIKKIWNRNEVIIQKDNSYRIDKSFLNTNETQNIFNVPSYEQMLLEMKDYMILNKKKYG